MKRLTLSVGRSSTSALSDLAPLAALTQLQDLDFRHSLVRNLGPLQHLHELRVLRADDTRISNVAPLAGLTKLRVLGLSRCRRLTSLAPIAGKLRQLVELHLPEHMDCVGLDAATKFPALRRVVHDASSESRNCLRENHERFVTFLDLRRAHTRDPFRVLDLVGKETALVDDDDWSQVAQFGATLQALTLPRLVTPRRPCFGWLAELTHLVRLDLGITSVAAAGVEVLARLASLRELVVGGVADVEQLACAPALCSRLWSLTVTEVP